jgi:hypothetical protein
MVVDCFDDDLLRGQLSFHSSRARSYSESPKLKSHRGKWCIKPKPGVQISHFEGYRPSLAAFPQKLRKPPSLQPGNAISLNQICCTLHICFVPRLGNERKSLFDKPLHTDPETEMPKARSAGFLARRVAGFRMCLATPKASLISAQGNARATPWVWSLDILEHGFAANPSRFGWRRGAEAQGNPEGIAIIQPRVARTGALPWVNPKPDHQL